jgi:outer membrane receptor protein involved in Fe transport
MKKTALLLSCGYGALLAMTGPAFAQTAATTDTSTTTSSTTAIQGISKSANGSGSTIAQAMAKKVPLKSQYAASHISKAEIDQKSPVATLDSILNTEPSVNATQAGPLGTQQQITFRAFNSAQFSQTYDNINLNDIFNGGATNESSITNNVLITPQDVGSVDLYRGINNPANNSYSSLAGTINYEPVLPSDTRGGFISGNYGSFGTFGYNGLYNTGKIDGVSNVVAFNHQGTNGWLEGDTDVNSNLYDSFNVDTGSTGKVYGIFVYNQNNGENAYDIPQNLINEYGRNFQWPKSVYNEPVESTDYMGILGTTQTINDFTTFDIKGFFSTMDFTRNAYSNPADQSTGYYVPNKDVNKTDVTYYGVYGRDIGVQPSLTFNLPYNIVTVGGNLTSGTEHSEENYSNTDPAPNTGSNYIWNEHDSRTLYSAYIQDEIDLFNDRLKITPGVKYLYANTKSQEQGNTYDYGTAGTNSGQEHYTSPTVGVSYEVLPNTVIYGAYGQNIEFPSISAFYDDIDAGAHYNQMEPTNLEPEHVVDYEAGLRYSNPRYGFLGALGFYLENFDNTFITEVDPDTGISTTKNGGSSTYKGIELQLAQDFGEKHIENTDVGDFTGYMNYSYNKAYFTNKTPLAISGVGSQGASTSTVTYGMPVARVPQSIVNFGTAWSLNGWGANVDARYVGSEYINQAGAGATSQMQEPAYFVLNLGFSKTIPLVHSFAKSVRFQFNVDNLLDREYDAFAYGETYSTSNGKGAYNAPAGSKGSYESVEEAAPRAFYGSITMNF